MHHSQLLIASGLVTPKSPSFGQAKKSQQTKSSSHKAADGTSLAVCTGHLHLLSFLPVLLEWEIKDAANSLEGSVHLQQHHVYCTAHSSNSEDKLVHHAYELAFKNEKSKRDRRGVYSQISQHC